MIKRICCKTPVIVPIDPKWQDEPIWIICDASKSGIGAVHELETLAILEALLKWEDKLIGYRIHIIMGNQALEFFKTQAHLSGCQRRWMDYLSRFDFDITYVKGELNKVADCLSRYYESDTRTDAHEPHKYVQADARIDRSGEDLPMQRLQEITSRVIELRAIQDTELR
jgi:hypothetical protein